MLILPLILLSMSTIALQYQFSDIKMTITLIMMITINEKLASWCVRPFTGNKGKRKVLISWHLLNAYYDNVYLSSAGISCCFFTFYVYLVTQGYISFSQFIKWWYSIYSIIHDNYQTLYMYTNVLKILYTSCLFQMWWLWC